VEIEQDLKVMSSFKTSLQQLEVLSLYLLIKDFGKSQNKCKLAKDFGPICYCDDMYLCQIG
jgi:hypothetical protein